MFIFYRLDLKIAIRYNKLMINILNKNKINLTGFTLAETLITLAIIGVVVAITLPMLKNYMSHRYITSARKHYYDVEKLMRSIQSELGVYENWGYVNRNFATAYIDKRLYYVKKTQNIEDFYPGAGSYFSGTVYLLNDASILVFAPMTTYRPHLTMIFFDVNGVEEPNALGVDIYLMVLNLSPTLDQDKFPYGISLGKGGCARLEFNQNNGPYRPDAGNGLTSSCLQILRDNNWTSKEYPITNFGK